MAHGYVLEMVSCCLQRGGARAHCSSVHIKNVRSNNSFFRYIPNSIFLTPETEIGWEASLGDLEYDPTTQPVFDTGKDLSVPPFMDHPHVLGLSLYAKSTSKRSILASFAGKLWKDVAEAFAVRNAVKTHFGSVAGRKFSH